VLKTVKRLKTAVTSDAAGAELAAAINSQVSGPAALVASVGTQDCGPDGCGLIL